jgi:hypothetical protein
MAENVYIKLLSRLTSAIGVPIAIGLFWVLIGDVREQGKMLTDLSTSIRLIEQRVSQRETAYVDLASRVGVIELTRYSGADAQRDMAPFNVRLDGLERQIEKLSDGR